MSYNRKDYKVNHLRQMNVRESKKITNELQKSNPNHNVINGCFANIKKNQNQITKLIRQQRVRNYYVSQKRK